MMGNYGYFYGQSNEERRKRENKKNKNEDKGADKGRCTCHIWVLCVICEHSKEVIKYSKFKAFLSQETKRNIKNII